MTVIINKNLFLTFVPVCEQIFDITYNDFLSTYFLLKLYWKDVGTYLQFATTGDVGPTDGKGGHETVVDVKTDPQWAAPPVGSRGPILVRLVYPRGLFGGDPCPVKYLRRHSARGSDPGLPFL